MVGETLGKIRARIETLSTADGDYCVLCGRTGVRPVPVADQRFPDRETAEEAAQTATAYRSVLRRWDPRAPCYDFIACEVPDGVTVAPDWSTTTAGRVESSLTSFCHDVAAAVFEALSNQGFAEIESTIMDEYCTSADAIDDPDDLCLHLLATLSVELADRLTQSAQARVLRTAASEFSGPEKSDTGLARTFDRLQTVGIIDDYSIESQCVQTVGKQSWTVTVDEYALSDRAEAVPTLPIAIDLLRRLPRAHLTLSAGRERSERTWEFELTATETGSSAGLARVQST